MNRILLKMEPKSRKDSTSTSSNESLSDRFADIESEIVIHPAPPETQVETKRRRGRPKRLITDEERKESKSNINKSYYSKTKIVDQLEKGETNVEKIVVYAMYLKGWSKAMIEKNYKAYSEGDLADPIDFILSNFDLCKNAQSSIRK